MVKMMTETEWAKIFEEDEMAGLSIGQGPEVQHNATGEYACTECGHQGNGQVPGCTCIGCDDTCGKALVEWPYGNCTERAGHAGDCDRRQTTAPRRSVPEARHNGTDEYPCTECGHRGVTKVTTPGCPCIGCEDMEEDVEIETETACVAHGAEGCEWCFPVSSGLTAPVGPEPSTGAILAAGALKSASRVSGLVTVFVHWELLERMCELGLLREDQEHDVFVDSAGYKWLRNGADVAALDNLLQVS